MSNDRQNTGIFQTDVMVTLERLETHIEALVGNGQPGRIKIIEDKQEEHASRLNLLWGGLILLAFLSTCSLAAAAFEYFTKH